MAQISFPPGMWLHVLHPWADDQGLPGNYGVSDYDYPADQVRNGYLWWQVDAPDLPKPGDRIQVDRNHMVVVSVGPPRNIRVAEGGRRVEGRCVCVKDVTYI